MLAQWRQSYGNHIQAVIQVLPELTPLDCLLQVLVRRSQDARVKRQQAVSTEPFKFTLLQDPQELGL